VNKQNTKTNEKGVDLPDPRTRTLQRTWDDSSDKN